MLVASAIACGALTMGAAAASGKEPRRGFKGPFTPIDFPGAPRTIAGGINDQGKIVGRVGEPKSRAERGTDWLAASDPSPLASVNE
jgi:hypothetical protein